VIDVCRPDRLHSVSPWRMRYRRVGMRFTVSL
jgi:hypothetical protein